MQICMLVQPQHQPVPDSITKIQSFGNESIIVNNDIHNPISGEAILLSGSSEDFVNWLKSFDGIWLSDSPAIGNWEVYHIKG